MIRRSLLALCLVAGAPAALSAQYYFGQNKVQYRAFDFQVLRTEHFDIHFYPEARAAALDAGRMAERSYQRLSRLLRHEYKERKPIILYASHSDFQQTNALGGESPGEGTGGVTDFFKQRIILPFTGSYQELEHVLQHEMVHQFQYDIWSRGRAGAGLQTIINVNPPLWFVEGMAEYFSIGGVDPNTAMWLRDASFEGKIPSINQLETDPQIFPYRFGQALLAFIGERWGDEAIGAIMQGTLAGGGGLEGSIRRVLGVNYRELSDLWKEAVQKRYLPEVGTRQKARDIAGAMLNESRSEGTLHLAPALSPDGSQVAYFSEKDFYFVDLYLADANTGKVKKRLLKSSYSSNYETYRFINSAASWSPDGKYIAIAAKRGARDEIVIIDVAKNSEYRRIKVTLNGVTTPAWSPDGRQLVFTGYDGGLSDLFIVNVAGGGLVRLTNDKYADLNPVWSPDGKTIAFATDRGPETDFATLRIGNTRIALYDVATGRIDGLPDMELGTNRSPQWSPDGQDIAFVSDRNGVSDIYLYNLNSRQTYAITDLYTGAQGITPLSPVLSWARNADRLAFGYYSRGRYDVYGIDNPRGLKREPWVAPLLARRDSAMGPIGVLNPPDSNGIVTGYTPVLPRRDSAMAPIGVLNPPDSNGVVTGYTPITRADTARRTTPKDTVAAAGEPLESTGSLYVSGNTFRQSDSAPALPDSAPRPATITELMHAADIPLPDTAEFTVKKYRVRYRPDFVARPTVGYTRDSFGRGFYGGSAIALSDMLGDHNLLFSAYVNGRITEAAVNATYVNMAHRINWAVGVGQEPYYFLEASQIISDSFLPTSDDRVFVTNLRRIVVRSVATQAYYPLSRFARIEFGATAAAVSDKRQQILERYDPGSGQATAEAVSREVSLNGASYVQPSLAYAFDNSLPGYVGPFYGRRYRFSVAQSIGGWRFFEGLADYRRYDRIVGPFTLATRALYFGRIGRDADRFRIYLGSTDLLRGNTSGSYYRNECRTRDPGTYTGCIELDRLVGTQLAVASAEIRFPLLNSSFGFVPNGFPPIEGALFYDIGMAWNEGDKLKFNRAASDDPIRVRTPAQTIGASARMNLFNFVVLRLDYSIPQERRSIKGYWTLSLGPVF
ncbi:MAG: BamA/TamA family outer membrane protein [Gemmatimonadota bacterium]|nr:BamA/TamA family outer membrane protein [Gemmatimonadota bacterium]